MASGWGWELSEVPLDVSINFNMYIIQLQVDHHVQNYIFFHLFTSKCHWWNKMLYVDWLIPLKKKKNPTPPPQNLNIFYLGHGWVHSRFANTSSKSFEIAPAHLPYYHPPHLPRPPCLPTSYGIKLNWIIVVVASHVKKVYNDFPVRNDRLSGSPNLCNDWYQCIAIEP